MSRLVLTAIAAFAFASPVLADVRASVPSAPANAGAQVKPAGVPDVSGARRSPGQAEGGEPAEAVREKSLNDPASHKHRTYSMVALDAEAGWGDAGDVAAWDGEAWIGGGRNKLWLKSEGEAIDGDLEKAELQALWSRQISTFWDVQAGARYDFEPQGVGMLALGVEGLAPYQFETQATGFLTENGDLSARFKQSFDVRLTQRLVLEPEVELNAWSRDVPALDVGAGLSDVEANVKLRYEVTRKFAPYVAVAYERRLGETASIARADGEDVEETSVRVGVRTWF